MKMDINEARQFFADFFYGEHHLPSQIRRWGEGFYVFTHDSLATTDFNELTRLVFMAHARAVRVEVASHGPKHLKIIIHKRDAEDSRGSFGHPTLEQALERHNRYMDAKRELFKIHPESRHAVHKSVST